jgi:hypothetical protein
MLKQRIITALALLAVLLPALFAETPQAFLILSTLLIAAGAWVHPVRDLLHRAGDFPNAAAAEDQGMSATTANAQGQDPQTGVPAPPEALEPGDLPLPLDFFPDPFPPWLPVSPWWPLLLGQGIRCAGLGQFIGTF